MTELNDFGFTAVNEDELASVEISKKIADESSATVQDLEHRLDTMHKAIGNLLNNLKMNPDKEYILWPDRVKKIEEFQKNLQSIRDGGHK